jgi:hypothetical protein
VLVVNKQNTWLARFNDIHIDVFYFSALALLSFVPGQKDEVCSQPVLPLANRHIDDRHLSRCSPALNSGKYLCSTSTSSSILFSEQVAQIDTCTLLRCCGSLYLGRNTSGKCYFLHVFSQHDLEALLNQKVIVLEPALLFTVHYTQLDKDVLCLQHTS